MKLTDMQAIVAKATKRPWTADDTTVFSPGDDITDVADCALSASPARDPEEWANALADAIAITALANHADALLELWRAIDGYALAMFENASTAAKFNAWQLVLEARAKLEAIP